MESKALYQESDILLLQDITNLKTLCEALYSKELLSKEIYKKSFSSQHDLSLPYETVNALLKKVKDDQRAFESILTILQNTQSFEQVKIEASRITTNGKAKNCSKIMAGL